MYWVAYIDCKDDDDIIIRLRWMQEMWSIVTNEGMGILSVMWAGCAKMAEQIDILFGVETCTRWRSPSLHSKGEGFDAVFVK